MPDRDGNRPGGGQGGKLARISKTASFWFLLVLIPLLMFRVFSPQREESAELSYSQMSGELDRGNVQKVTIVDGQRVEGTLRSPLRVDDKRVQQFWTRLPFKDDAGLLTQLKARGVEIG